MPSLCDLPDEILLEAVRGLEAIRSYETQSMAFKHKGTEKGRQRENHIRQRTLYALCLASHRLRCISLPSLYASSITCATWSGLKRLQLLHRTLSSPNYALGQSKRLVEHIRYVENRLADYQGNSLQDDETFQEKLASSYFQLLAKVVSRAPNIDHLCVVSVEHDDVSFWSHLLGKSHSSMNIASNGPAKLEYLSIQIHAHTWSSIPGVSVFERISLNLRSFTRLSELRISGATTNREYGVVFHLGDIPNIRRLDLTECNLETAEVACLLLACKNVRNFTCKWAFLNGAYFGPSELRAALLAHRDMLETLTLDFREIRYSPHIDPDRKMLGSLRPLRTLKSLKICEMGFLSSDLSLLDYPDQALDFELSALLPKSLEQMTLLTNGDFNDYNDVVLEDAFCLWQLAYDRKLLVPHLERLCVKARHDLTAPNLAMAFQKGGVRFCTQREE